MGTLLTAPIRAAALWKPFVTLIGDLMAALIFNSMENMWNVLSDRWYCWMDFEKFNLCVVWGTVFEMYCTWLAPQCLSSICTCLTWDNYTRKKGRRWRRKEKQTGVLSKSDCSRSFPISSFSRILVPAHFPPPGKTGTKPTQSTQTSK